MPRIARLVVPEFPHHITHRGNRKLPTFCDETDRAVYMRLLGEYAKRYALRIWAYTLMTNHIHLVAVPDYEDSLAAVIRDAHGNYAKYFNQVHGATGHLWEGRFYSSVLDSGHLRRAVRYVERNPVRAGITRRGEDYEWSSAQAHCRLRVDPLLTDPIPPGEWPRDWSSWLDEEVPAEETARVRRQTFLGRPLGTESFVVGLERQLGRRLRPRPRGRPKREEDREGRLKTNRKIGT